MFFTDEDVTWPERALPPGTESKKHIKLEVLKDIECKSGKIAPWFDQPGGGMQYVTKDIQIRSLTGNMVDATLENLLSNGYVRIVK